MQNSRVWLLAVALGLSGCYGNGPNPTVVPKGIPAPVGPAKNVILMIASGMGPKQVEATRIFQAGPDGALTFEARMDGPTLVSTDSVDTPPLDPDPTLREITDSEAAATALATGRVGKNLHIGVLGNGDDLLTILELATFYGKGTGIVTTAEVHDATPASFIAEVVAENDDLFAGGEANGQPEMTAILEEYNRTLPNVLLGGGRRDWDYREAVEKAIFAGYTSIRTSAQLESMDLARLPRKLPTGPGLLGLFEGNLEPFEGGNTSWQFWCGDCLTLERDRRLHPDPTAQPDPRLPDMTAAALATLEGLKDGFFLLVENDTADNIGHYAGDAFAGSGPNDAELTAYMVEDLAAFDEAVGVVLDWVAARGLDDTLVIVTGDKETGGFAFPDGAYTAGDVVPGTFPDAPYNTTTPVPVYALGPESARALGARHLKDVYFAMQVGYTNFAGPLFPDDFFDRFIPPDRGGVTPAETTP